MTTDRMSKRFSLCGYVGWYSTCLHIFDAQTQLKKWQVKREKERGLGRGRAEKDRYVILAGVKTSWQVQKFGEVFGKTVTYRQADRQKEEEGNF